VLGAWRPHLVVIDMDIGGDVLLRRMAPTGVGGPTPSTGPGLDTARRSEGQADRLRAGVDDIMTIPFSPERAASHACWRSRVEATARISRSIRSSRSASSRSTSCTVRSGPDHPSCTLPGSNRACSISWRPEPAMVVTRDEILDTLWGTDYVSESNVVDRHVRNLRAKLQNDWRKPRFIATVPGKGYRFIPTFTDPPPTTGRLITSATIASTLSSRRHRRISAEVPDDERIEPFPHPSHPR